MTTLRRPVYFTLSDGNFSPRTLAMIESVLAFDKDAELIFFHFDDMKSSQLAVFERSNVEVISIRRYLGSELTDSLANSRNYIEFLWTLPSVLAREVMLERIDLGYSDVVYLDADLFFFGPPEQIWKEVPPGKISIVKHNFSERLELAFSDSGQFNVSWVSFPLNPFGLECAANWASDCIDACPSIPIIINKRLVYGDQLYLDEWPVKYEGHLHVIENIGAGVAPWNYENYEISNSLPIFVDSVPLIFFHFSSHQFGFPFSRKMGSVYSAVKPIPAKIYWIYEKKLRECASELGMQKWKSRYQPLPLRALKFLIRRFKSSK